MGQVALYVVPAMMLFWALIKRQEIVKAGISTVLLLVKIQYLPFFGFGWPRVWPCEILSVFGHLIGPRYVRLWIDFGHAKCAQLSRATNTW